MLLQPNSNNYCLLRTKFNFMRRGFIFVSMKFILLRNGFNFISMKFSTCAF